MAAEPPIHSSNDQEHTQSVELSPQPKRALWFPIALALIVAFLTIVVMRDRIRAAWWEHRLIQAAAPLERAHYLARIVACGKSGTGAIFRLSRHENPEIRSLALFGLQALASAKSRSAIAIMMRTDADPDVRHTAALALAFQPDEQSISNLRQASSPDEPCDGAMAAVAALSRIDSQQSAGTLMDVLRRHPAPAVRAQAAESLGSLLDRPAAGRAEQGGVFTQSAGTTRCDIVAALVNSLVDAALFEGELALEAEISRAEAAMSGAGHPVQKDANPGQPSHRTIADVSAAWLTKKSGKRVEPMPGASRSTLQEITAALCDEISPEKPTGTADVPKPGVPPS